MQRNVEGVGDVRLLGGRRLNEGANGSSALRVSVKLPTGDSDSLLGSGGTDITLGLAGDRTRLLGAERLASFYRINATWLGEHEIGIRHNNPLVGQVSGGICYRLTSRSSLALQALLRSPVYDSEVSPLGDLAASVTMGVLFRLPHRYSLAFSVGEDIHPHSMPDVTFGIQLQADNSVRAPWNRAP